MTTVLCMLSFVQSMFTKSLSQRIRHIRDVADALKSLLPSKPADEVPQKRLRLKEFVSCVPGDAGESSWSDVDISAHLAELKREWTSKNRNTAHLKMLLTHTQNYRYV